MPISTDSFAETTEQIPLIDVLDDTLEPMRITGNLLLRESYTPPWGVSIPAADKLSRLLGTRPGVRIAAFHLVEYGHCEIALADGQRAVLTAGDFAVCFGGEAHQITLGEKQKCVSIESLLAGSKNQRAPHFTNKAPGTSLICGVFLLHHTLLNPLFTALPPLLHASMSRAGELRNLTGVARMMAEEMEHRPLASGYVVKRLLEVLCAEAIRAHIETLTRQEIGWLGSIKDPVIGRAIAAIHTQPGNAWSVEKMAQHVSMSPSRFAARFSAALNDSPMAYVAKWRMNLACRRLVETQQSIEQIAMEVGYENSAAFNRAFKKLVGLPPAAWRTRERA